MAAWALARLVVLAYCAHHTSCCTQQQLDAAKKCEPSSTLSAVSGFFGSTSACETLQKRLACYQNATCCVALPALKIRREAVEKNCSDIPPCELKTGCAADSNLSAAVACMDGAASKNKGDDCGTTSAVTKCVPEGCCGDDVVKHYVEANTLAGCQALMCGAQELVGPLSTTPVPSASTPASTSRRWNLPNWTTPAWTTPVRNTTVEPPTADPSMGDSIGGGIGGTISGTVGNASAAVAGFFEMDEEKADCSTASTAQVAKMKECIRNLQGTTVKRTVKGTKTATKKGTKTATKKGTGKGYYEVQVTCETLRQRMECIPACCCDSDYARDIRFAGEELKCGDIPCAGPEHCTFGDTVDRILDCRKKLEGATKDCAWYDSQLKCFSKEGCCEAWTAKVLRKTGDAMAGCVLNECPDTCEVQSSFAVADKDLAARQQSVLGGLVGTLLVAATSSGAHGCGRCSP